MSQIKDMGTENEEPGGPLITACILRVMWREGRGKVLKATRFRPAAAPVSTASTSSRQTHAFHFPPFFPSFFSAPHTPDRTPRLPSARHPPAARAQRGSSETPRKGPGPPQRAGKEGGRPSPQQPRGSGRDTRTHRGSCHSRPCRLFFFFFFFFFCKSPWLRGGEKKKLFKLTLGRAPWGSRSNLRTGCLSSAAEKRIAQGLSLSRSWIKLQTQTPPFSTQQTVMANIAIWTLKTHYK